MRPKLSTTCQGAIRANLCSGLDDDRSITAPVATVPGIDAGSAKNHLRSESITHAVSHSPYAPTRNHSPFHLIEADAPQNMPASNSQALRHSDRPFNASSKHHSPNSPKITR